LSRSEYYIHRSPFLIKGQSLEPKFMAQS
jgi:hypothetical protein